MRILTEKRKSSEAPLNTEVPDDFGTFTSVLSDSYYYFTITFFPLMILMPFLVLRKR